MEYEFINEWHDHKTRATRMAQLRELANKEKRRREGMILAGVIALLTIITYYL